MSQMTDVYVEVVGRVEKDDTLKMMTVINMGSVLGTHISARDVNAMKDFSYCSFLMRIDMKLVDDCIELMHGSQFTNMF